MDTRNPVGLMPAASFGPGENGRITLTFEPFAIAGFGVGKDHNSHGSIEVGMQIKMTTA
jgi:hypothetical protein